MPQPTLLTVLLNYRTAAMTLKSAEAALVAMDGMAGELVIVDNASGDGSFETLLAEAGARGWLAQGRVRVLQSGHNGGFGAGNNFGIRAGLSDGGRPDYIYILNSDAFPEPDAIRALCDYLQAHPEAGFAGSYIYGPEDGPHLTAFRFPTIAGELEGQARFGPISRLLKRSIVPLAIPAATSRVDWLAGASLMMRRSVLDKIGLFDEAFFLYFEETDLCLRAARAGWATVYVCESRVAHIGGVSTGMKRWTRVPDYWLQSRSHYFRKNHGPVYAAGAACAHVAGALLWRVRVVLQGKPRNDPPHYLLDFLTHSIRNALTGFGPTLRINRAGPRLPYQTVPKSPDRRKS